MYFRFGLGPPTPEIFTLEAESLGLANPRALLKPTAPLVTHTPLFPARVISLGTLECKASTAETPPGPSN